MTIAENIVSVANKYIGKKELPNNSGFQDAEFQKKMAAVGWHKGESWCCYLAELIWEEAIPQDNPVYAFISKLFSGSSVATWANFSASPHFKTGKVPKVGAVVIFRHGDGWQGHTGVVTGVVAGTNEFLTVEGNTNSDGSREGIEVDPKKRQTGLPFKAHGLNLIGFIYCPE